VFYNFHKIVFSLDHKKCILKSNVMSYDSSPATGIYIKNYANYAELFFIVNFDRICFLIMWYFIL
jgi:hypothetical protein